MTLEDRVDALERNVARYWGATMAMALVLVAGVTMGQSTRDVEFGEVKCKMLTVLGHDDSPAIVARGGPTDGAIRVYNHLGRVSTSILQTFADPSLSGTGLISVHSKDGLAVIEVRGDNNGGRLLLLNLKNTRDEAVRVLAKSWKPKNLRDGCQIRIKGEEIVDLMVSETPQTHPTINNAFKDPGHQRLPAD